MFDRAPSWTVIHGSFFLGLLLSAIGCQRDADSNDPAVAVHKKVQLAAAGEPAVELVIDYRDGAEKRFTRIPHEEGMTVLAALRFAASHPRGITFENTGRGSSALLTKIDGVANEAGQNSKNWLYRVNGKLADKSAGAYVLSPGDVILWRFEEDE